MKLKEIVGRLHLTLLSGEDKLEKDVSGAYAGDLLSDVIANGKEGDLWITMQTHVNIVGVAVLRDLAGIVLVRDRQPADETLKKAADEHVPLLSSSLNAFELAGRLYGLIKGGG